MTATRRSVKSTVSCGHWPVWYQRPWKSARPGTSGTRPMDRQPAAEMTMRARTSSPTSVRTVHSRASSSQSASVTRVWKRMSRSRS